ncbi:MAG: DUF4037 domain-containing protein [Chloroflexota bacterium]|nr:DUF4037 domain-containing protein [Chloroflexota bacterium]
MPDPAPEPAFIPGLKLNGLFYREAVAPVLARAFPGLRYGAARIGSGSEVLGFDDRRSTDHEWGPRLILFLGGEEVGEVGEAIRATLREELPHRFRGFPVSYGPPDDEGVSLPAWTDEGPVNHKVYVDTVARFVEERLGLRSYPQLDVGDWLLCSEQGLLEVTAGEVYHDGLGELGAMRAALAYYPRDVWLYLLAAQWTRISQQEAFVGRTGEVGDDLGSRLVTAALVRDLMRLCFLMERRYAPYAKWFGTAFARLESAARLRPALDGALAAGSWREREAHLGRAYTAVAELHNGLGITAPLSTEVAPYHGRPFVTIRGERFAAAILARIEDPRVQTWPAGVGSVDQWVDSTDVLQRADRRARLRTMYDEGR